MPVFSKRASNQSTLFDTSRTLPNGFVYRPYFITEQEEAELIGYIEDLPLRESRVGEYYSKRRVLNFGWNFYEKHGPKNKLPPFLQPLQRKVAKWLDIPVTHVVEALVTEYRPGAGIGWHCDNEPCEYIIGISLSGWCSLRLRPLRSRRHKRLARETLSFPLERRSAYIMQGESRWSFQHAITPVETLRYSITFRTVLTTTHPKYLPSP